MSHSPIQPFRVATRRAGLLAASALLAGCTQHATLPAPSAEPSGLEQTARVTATAYNSLRDQTDGTPKTTALGVHLQPGMRVIGVSEDLYELGLRKGTHVRIDGLPGEWEVADKMDPRWHHRIDIYMGNDEHAALEFGKKEVTLHWTSGEAEDPHAPSDR